MKLWEINAEIERIFAATEWNQEAGENGAWVDTDTGEIKTEEQIREELHNLDMDRLEILRYLAKETLNERAVAKSLKEEESRLKGLREAHEKREERLLSILNRECDGKKTDLGVAVYSYRPSTQTEIFDEEAALEYLQDLHEEAVKYQMPKLDKNEIKKILKSGEPVPGCRLVDNINGSLK